MSPSSSLPSIRLDDTLVMHGVRDAEDAARFATFNATVNGADQGATCAALLHHHPTVNWDDFLLVEDETTGAVVSTTCAIPWRVALEGVTLDAAMLEMVVTHPDYRRRGLVRKQIDHFHRRADARNVDFTIIEGIPYYYRQFGYGYALDHGAMDTLSAVLVPDSPTPSTLQIRRATRADIPQLAALHQLALGAHPLHAVRTQADWAYLLDAAQYPTFLLTNAMDDAPIGYVCGWRSAQSGTLSLVESAFTDRSAVLPLLQRCKPLAALLRLREPAQSTLIAVARTLGSHASVGEQWLIRIPDLPRLLQKLAPVWEARLVAADFPRLTTQVVLNFYRQAYRLRFVEGTLTGVDNLGFVDASMGAEGGDLCIPPDAFTRLLFGYRDLDELRDAWPDIAIKPARRALLDALFPKRAAHLRLPYMHCGFLEQLPFTDAP
jgi:predicted N-acetyltransferase YhbS